MKNTYCNTCLIVTPVGDDGKCIVCSNCYEKRPSPLLRYACLAYWIEHTDNPQGEACGILHQLVIAGLRTEGVDFEDREHAARIAKEIAGGQCLI